MLLLLLFFSLSVTDTAWCAVTQTIPKSKRPLSLRLSSHQASGCLRPAAANMHDMWAWTYLNKQCRMSGVSEAIKASIMASSTVSWAFSRFLQARRHVPSIPARHLPNLQFSPPLRGSNTVCGPLTVNTLDSKTVTRRGVHSQGHESRSLLPHAFVVKVVFCLPTVDGWVNIKVGIASGSSNVDQAATVSLEHDKYRRVRCCYSCN